jgi:RNA polymerase sigma-70 factor (ECF subfamily)
MTNLARDLRRMVLMGGAAGLTDAELLERFLTLREDSAFESLVRRHGPMVFGVCRRVLHHEQDAEDAFQATFLVLVRKAATIWPREMLPNWLFGVAYRTALAAKTAAVRRRLRERQVNPMPPTKASDQNLWPDLQPILDEELSHLPNKYRVPIVLCDLEGKSRQEAAQQLGWLPGTLSGRLARARSMLAKRLTRRGLTVSGAVLAASFGQNLASANLPPSLLSSTVKASLMVAAGRAATALISANVIALSQGVLRTMLMTKIKILAVVFLTLGVSIAGVGRLAYPALAGDSASSSLAAILDSEAKFGENPQVAGLESDEAADEKPIAKDSKREQIVGSGKAVTKEYQLKDFNSVDISSIFHVEISQGASFQTSITADDNLFDYIKAVKEDSTLHLSLDSKDKSIHTTVRLKAKVTMPSLRNLKISGASHATVSGFKSSPVVDVHVDGASHLKGNLETKKFSMEASGASHVELSGSATEAKLEGSGASHMDLGEFTFFKVDVILSGASHATIQAKSKLDYSVSGASHLSYRGDPTIGRSEKSGASHAGHKKEKTEKRG